MTDVLIVVKLWERGHVTQTQSMNQSFFGFLVDVFLRVRLRASALTRGCPTEALEEEVLHGVVEVLPRVAAVQPVLLVRVDLKQATRRIMHTIKLKIFPVPVRLHSGYGKFVFVIISPLFLQYLRTMYIVWRLVRRRDTRRLTRL